MINDDVVSVDVDAIIWPPPTTIKFSFTTTSIASTMIVLPVPTSSPLCPPKEHKIESSRYVVGSMLAFPFGLRLRVSVAHLITTRHPRPPTVVDARTTTIRPNSNRHAIRTLSEGSSSALSTRSATLILSPLCIYIDALSKSLTNVISHSWYQKPS